MGASVRGKIASVVVVAALAALIFVAGVALGRFGVFPILPWRVPVLDALGAAVATANATWVLAGATVLAFGATVGVFASAFILQRRQSKNANDLQRRQFEDDRAKALEARTKNCRDALETIRRAREVVMTMRDKYCQLGMPSKQADIWRDLSEIQTNQIIVGHFIASPVTDLEVLFLLGSTSHRLHEARDALKKLVPEPARDVEEWEKGWCRAVLQNASVRVVDEQAKLAEAVRLYD
jgi:hypothetical protein